jgi:hypothetical protein
VLLGRIERAKQSTSTSDAVPTERVTAFRQGDFSTSSAAIPDLSASADKEWSTVI